MPAGLLPDFRGPPPVFLRGLALLACFFPAHQSYQVTKAQIASPLAVAALALVGAYTPAVLLSRNRHPLLVRHAILSAVCFFVYANLVIAATAWEPGAAHFAALLSSLHLLHNVHVSLSGGQDLMWGQDAVCVWLQLSELGLLLSAWFMAPILSVKLDIVFYCTMVPEAVGYVLSPLSGFL